MKHFLFTLSMPNNNAWNGKWTGEGRDYVRGKSFRNSDERLDNFEEKGYLYDFGDGWVARVDVKEVTAQKRRKAMKNSDGFCGYDWMIHSIIKNGEIISG